MPGPPPTYRKRVLDDDHAGRVALRCRVAARGTAQGATAHGARADARARLLGACSAVRLGVCAAVQPDCSASTSVRPAGLNGRRQMAAIARSRGTDLASRNTDDFPDCDIVVVDPRLAKPWLGRSPTPIGLPWNAIGSRVAAINRRRPSTPIHPSPNETGNPRARSAPARACTAPGRRA